MLPKIQYHLGSSMDRTYPDGRKIHLSLVANPSHLECVNPVVLGKARAKQFYCGDTEEDRRVSVLRFLLSNVELFLSTMI
jgi:2-oxoglutarate dehydrogenase E1 component